MECMNDTLSTSINSDLHGDLIPAEMWQGKARNEEIAQKGEIQVKTNFSKLTIFLKPALLTAIKKKTNVKSWQAEAKPRRTGILDQCFNWPGAAQNKYKDPSTERSKLLKHTVCWGRTALQLTVTPGTQPYSYVSDIYNIVIPSLQGTWI